MLDHNSGPNVNCPGMANGKGLSQAYDLRDLAAREALAIGNDCPTNPPLKPVERARRALAISALVKAWETASDRVRILRGHPLPGSRKPEPRKPKNGAKWSDVPPGAA